MQTIHLGKFKYQVPRGYKHCKWEYIHSNDTVYTVGVYDGFELAYGPFKVVGAKLRMMFKANRFIKPIK